VQLVCVCVTETVCAAGMCVRERECVCVCVERRAQARAITRPSVVRTENLGTLPVFCPTVCVCVCVCVCVHHSNCPTQPPDRSVADAVLARRAEVSVVVI
jgi:hypothetical protein